MVNVQIGTIPTAGGDSHGSIEFLVQDPLSLCRTISYLVDLAGLEMNLAHKGYGHSNAGVVKKVLLIFDLFIRYVVVMAPEPERRFYEDSRIRDALIDRYLEEVIRRISDVSSRATLVGWLCGEVRRSVQNGFIQAARKAV